MARSAAKIIHDFTCADAILLSYSNDSNEAPRILKGAKSPSALPSSFAPMLLSGVVTLFIGRERRYLSPVNTKCPFAELKSPQKRRIPVPELPQSKTSKLSCIPSEDISIICPSSFTVAPRFFTICREFIVSSPRRKFSILLVPSASMANITLLCEIDLSGAIFAISNENFFAGETTTLLIAALLQAHHLMLLK